MRTLIIILSIALASCQQQSKQIEALTTQNDSLTNQIEALTTQSKMDLTEEREAIEQVLGTYENALNNSDVEAAVALYTEDGVFMPTEAPTATGTEEIRASYTHVFNAIQLSIKFQIDEIEVDGNLAFAKTGSEGEVKVLAADITAPEKNRELFVFQKVNGAWKIARYMFNKAEPAAK
ncbi:MAG: SgcJ/EcaC family oxidoreductase [Bacteroidetes bacterium]|nr:SgcJ/EcaC family oxidoreductase [Bacteroidota bacterium]